MEEKKISKVLRCVKLEKKNYNEFIWIYWKMKIFFFFFGGLPIGGTNEKKMI